MSHELSHLQLKEQALADPRTRQTYHRLAHEFDILSQLVEARRKAKRTQADIAEKMNTTASAIARLESGGGKKHHSPSLRTLRMYADALDCDIKMELVPRADKAKIVRVETNV